jgi:hypothetical protein
MPSRLSRVVWQRDGILFGCYLPRRSRMAGVLAICDLVPLGVWKHSDSRKRKLVALEDGI